MLRYTQYKRTKFRLDALQKSSFVILEIFSRAPSAIGFHASTTGRRGRRGDSTGSDAGICNLVSATYMCMFWKPLPKETNESCSAAVMVWREQQTKKKLHRCNYNTNYLRQRFRLSFEKPFEIRRLKPSWYGARTLKMTRVCSHINTESTRWSHT